MTNDVIFTGGGGRFNAYYSFFRYLTEGKQFYQSGRITGVGTGAIAATLYASGVNEQLFFKVAEGFNNSLANDYKFSGSKSIRYYPSLYNDIGYEIRTKEMFGLLQKVLSPLSKIIYTTILPALKNSDSGNPFNYLHTPDDVSEFICFLLFDYGFFSMYGFRQQFDNFLKLIAKKKKGSLYLTGKGLTFRQHREAFNADLTIIATRANKEEPVYFNAIKTPNIAVTDAIRATIATPLMFKPTIHYNLKYKNKDQFLKADDLLASITDIDGIIKKVVDETKSILDKYGLYSQRNRNYTYSEAEMLLCNGVLNEGNLVSNFTENELAKGTVVLDINSLSQSTDKVDGLSDYLRNIFNAIRYNTTIIYAHNTTANHIKLNVDKFSEFNYAYSQDFLEAVYKASHKQQLSDKLKL